MPDEDARTLGGKLVVQLTWYGYSRSLFAAEWVEELLLMAGFKSVAHVVYRETTTPYQDIVELDNREVESLFVEAAK